METLALASEYLQKGLNVIPLRPRSKIPYGSWEPYQRTYASNEDIREWFSNGHADNNIAIITGKISSIFALDIDGEEANAHFNRAVEAIDDEGLKTALKYTLCIKTGSGNTNIVIGLRQEEFGSEDDKITNSVLWRSKNEDATHNEVRLKGEGGYIVAPPSIHPNGNRYELINGTSTVATLSKTQINKLISAIRNQSSPKNDSGSSMDGTNGAIIGAISGAKNTELNEEDVYDIVAILKPHYRNGNRNDFIMYLSGWMKKEGISFQSAFKVIECIAADDEEKSARIRTLEETYKKREVLLLHHL